MSNKDLIDALLKVEKYLYFGHYELAYNKLKVLIGQIKKLP
jgi:hypothetical protein